MDDVKELTEEQLEFAIDLTVTLVVDQLVSETGEDSISVLEKFVASGTGALLYDKTCMFWCYGPAYVVEMYKEELNRLESCSSDYDLKTNAFV